MREVLRRHGRLGEIFKLEGVTHYAAHGHGAVVLHRVVGGGQGLVLDGGGGDMAAHGVAHDVEAVRVGEAGDVGERQSQFVGVLDAGAHVVEVGGVAGGGPGVTVIQQPLANARVADGEFGTLAPVAVGVHHQAAVPDGRNLDAVAGAVGADAGPLLGVVVAGYATLFVEVGGLRFAGDEGAGVLDARRLRWLGDAGAAAVAAAAGQQPGAQQAGQKPDPGYCEMGAHCCSPCFIGIVGLFLLVFRYAK